MNPRIVGGITMEFVTGRMVGVKELGHVCFCHPLDGEQPDAVSAVANTNGFVPCTAVANCLGMRSACVLKAVASCNEAQRVHVVTPCEKGRRLRGAEVHSGTPAFVLTPRPPDYRLFDAKAAQRLMTEVLDVCTIHKIHVLRMTQFCMLFTPLPLHHLRGVRQAMEEYKRPSTLRQMVFDLDERHAPVLYEALAK